MTAYEIVDKLAREKVVEGIINEITDNGKMAKDASSLGDLAQMVYITLLTNEKFPAIYEEGHHMFWITRIVMNQIISTTSSYYRDYVRHRLMSENSEINDQTFKPDV